MGNSATVRTLAAVSALAAVAWSQPQAPDWRHVGNSAVELGLAGLASGPANRVWYSADGARLYVQTALAGTYVTYDFETWQRLADSAVTVPPAIQGFAPTAPEENAVLRHPASPTPRVYAFGRDVHRSDDSGRHWENTTGWRGISIIGEDLRDLAVSPTDEDELTVASAGGVFRSVDAGRSWHGLNDELPNLPVARLLEVPVGDRGARLELSNGAVLEWQPGERVAWRRTRENASFETALRRYLVETLNLPVTAATVQGSFFYVGLADGRISVSTDSLRTSTDFTVSQGGAVNAFWVDPADQRFAVAVLSARGNGGPFLPARVVRTINGGFSWDDLSANLPNTSVRGVTADRASNAIYVATDAGIFWARVNLATLGAPPVWNEVGGLGPRAVDVRLDAGANQLWAAMEGSGVYASLAPHRIGDPRVVSAADLVARPAAPGTLLSIEGAQVDAASAGGLPVPVLGSTAVESHIQIPYEASGRTVALAIEGTGGRRVLGPLELRPAAPAIFTEQDGSPWLLNADTGGRLDGMHPAHSRMRVQILATGLGRVRPDWPTGTPGPTENPPQVAVPVTAYLSGEPILVTRAVLAPRYIGYYLIEVEIPPIVSYGPADLYIEAGGQASNRVRVYIEP